MKVLQLVKYYDPCKGGMETVVKNIVEGIIEDSEEIDFVVYSNHNAPIFKKQIFEKNKTKHIKEITPVLFKSQPLNLRYPSLKKLLKETDVINHHYPFPTMEVALLRNLDILKKKIFIITWHANIENSRWKAIKVVYNPLINSLLEACTKVVVTSPQLLENSKLLQGYAHKVEVIPLSFDPEITNFNVIKERKFPKNRKFKLLFIGRLREYKGVKYLIEAIKNLDVELTIVGDGEKELELRELVESFGISSKVAFFKNALNSEIAEYYQNSDLFILPSINEAEAFGIVQLEAMSNALPVINTNLNSGVPFVSLDRISGLTVEPANSEALEKAILEISSNEGFYEELSINSLERSKSFTRSKMANSYLKLYKNNTN